MGVRQVIKQQTIHVIPGAGKDAKENKLPKEKKR